MPTPSGDMTCSRLRYNRNFPSQASNNINEVPQLNLCRLFIHRGGPQKTWHFTFVNIFADN